MSPPKVPPGSDAAKIAAEMRRYIEQQGENLTTSELERYAKERMQVYGVDPVTSAASANTISVMAQRDPANTSLLAESIVARTVADPSTVGERIRNNVAQQVSERGGAAKLSQSERAELAYAEASSAYQRAGIIDAQSYADLKTRVHNYIDEGVSPEVAASAAAAPGLAQAAPQADSLSIFGYLVMLVNGDVNYTFNNTETLHVKGSAIHNHMMSTKYSMNDYNFHVKCDTIKTQSTDEFLNIRPHFGYGLGIYPSAYKALIGASFSVYAVAAKAGERWLIIGGYSYTGTKQRVYLAGIDNDIVVNNYGIKKTNGPAAEKRKSVITIEKVQKFITERCGTRNIK